MFKPASIETLIGCCRNPVDVSGFKRAPLDLEDLFRAAVWHNVLLQLYAALQLASESIPAEYHRKVRAAAQEVIAKNIWLLSELSEILGIFEQRGVPCLVLKGPALAVMTHGSIARRQFSDLDLLIKPKDAIRVESLLAERGYKANRACAIPGEAGSFREEYQVSFLHAGGHNVEIHWGLQEAKFICPELSADRWWSRAVKVNLGATVLTTLNRVDLFLFLCVHGAKHAWDRLKWLNDLAALGRNFSPADWNEVFAYAENLRATRVLEFAIQLTREILQVDAPACSNSFDELSAQVRARLAEPSGMLAVSQFHLAMMERKRDKIRYCARTALIPTLADRQIVRIPNSLAMLYTLVRPMRLLYQMTAKRGELS